MYAEIESSSGRIKELEVATSSSSNPFRAETSPDETTSFLPTHTTTGRHVSIQLPEDDLKKEQTSYKHQYDSEGSDFETSSIEFQKSVNLNVCNYKLRLIGLISSG
jgi:hypothetical protein